MMTGPKTLNAAIRASCERSPAAAASKRYRARKREGYTRAGAMDFPPEIVRGLVERGILGSDHVTWDNLSAFDAPDEGIPRVDPKVLNSAMYRLLDMMTSRPDEFLEFLKDDPATRGIPWRQIYDRTFQQAIGLPSHAPAMRHDAVMRAHEDHGFEVTSKKKSLGDQ